IFNADRLHVGGLRCDGGRVVVQCSFGLPPESISPTEYAEISPSSLQCRPCDNTNWDQLSSGAALVESFQQQGAVRRSEYRARGGIRIIQETCPTDRSTISRTDANGATAVLLREETGRFWSRRLASGGLQYP